MPSRRFLLAFFWAFPLSIVSFSLASNSWAGEVHLIWSGTTGSGTTGTSEIYADPGDQLQLDVVVIPDGAGLSGVSLSIQYPSADLDATSHDETRSYSFEFESHFHPDEGLRVLSYLNLFDSDGLTEFLRS